MILEKRRIKRFKQAVSPTGGGASSETGLNPNLEKLLKLNKAYKGGNANSSRMEPYKLDETIQYI